MAPNGLPGATESNKKPWGIEMHCNQKVLKWKLHLYLGKQ